MLKYTLISLYAIIVSIYAMSLEDIVGWNRPIRPEHRVLQAIGGIDQFEFEVKNVIRKASSLHNDRPASLVEFNYGSNSLIAKICFLDGICWAAKMMENRPLNERVISSATEAMTLIERYCQDIPIPKLRGLGPPQGKLIYYFTEWIDAKPLSANVSGSGATFSIPEKVVISLAEFVYNLTTCPIPKQESENLSRLYADRPVSKQIWDSFNLVTGNNNVLEVISTTVWVKMQFVVGRLIFSKSLKPFEGLDEMLLLSWVNRKLLASDHQQFVLHHWDMGMQNILIDEDNNLCA
jgi:hypothetical protein